MCSGWWKELLQRVVDSLINVHQVPDDHIFASNAASVDEVVNKNWPPS
ncbi:hypothetical protein AB46_3993 [Escherichia coli 3-267-03_S1_C2]|nr:hypothetical protein AB46_3993 [Escherichia coli 3-267-03_S1_C2]KDV80199.1 hypothetical protein AD25_3781 [Escherichia coli 2-052-05_S4_C3]